ncbi:phasin family protein [Paraburkholderia caribensis]|uniref:phasin family protein n=1 Tax=Paraburkholderia caribensis TaxID=75105 RepID=UPI001CAACF09|nr:phasin family protein [Paraburkholderia caribensis]CAG9256688.1 Phasin family protein [Paraburkholderia caribensis]
MESTGKNSIFTEYTKLFGQFKLPGIDMGAMLESRRKDIEAIAEANTTALAGVQSLAQKQSGILRTTLGELLAFVTRLTQGGQSIVNTGDTVKQTLHKALVDVQDLADTAYRAQSDSVAVVTKRVAERVEELKTLLQPKKK